MRHVRLDELSGSSLAEQVILAVHLHGQEEEFAGGHATPFVLPWGCVFSWFGDDDAFRRRRGCYTGCRQFPGPRGGTV
jgi:hypothetical protein